MIDLPSAQPHLQQTCNQLATDCISRQMAIDALDVLCQEHRYKIPGKRETYSQYNEAWQDALDRAEGAIGNLPPAQPERKKGKWIKTGQSFVFPEKFRNYSCSECGYDIDKIKFNFCPNCGADMRGE